jgi:hypothetical protein
VSRRSPKPPPDGTIGQMPVVVGCIGKKHASEALHWAAEEALYRAAALGSSGRGAPSNDDRSSTAFAVIDGALLSSRSRLRGVA